MVKLVILSTYRMFFFIKKKKGSVSCNDLQIIGFDKIKIQVSNQIKWKYLNDTNYHKKPKTYRSAIDSQQEWCLASAALEVEGTEAESTAQSSSIDKLVEASVLLESLRLVESKNCFREGCLILFPGANTCPLIPLHSVPNKLSCGNMINWEVHSLKQEFWKNKLS